MLFAAFPPQFSGAGIQGARLVAALARRGVAIEVVAPLPPDSGAPRREIADGAHIVRLALPRWGHRRALGLRLALWLLRHARHYDLVHIHGYAAYFAWPIRAASALGIPMLAKTTTLDEAVAFERGGDALARAFRKVDAIVALSQEIAEAFSRATDGAQRIERIPNGVDTALFRPAADPAERLAAREAFGLPPTAHVAVTCGMLYPRKNGLMLLEAGRRLASRNVCLVLAGPEGGDAAHARAIREAIEQLPEGVEARLLGPVGGEDIPTLLRAADVLTLTSREEGMPNSLLEGMAAGLPCIATDIPGSRDVLADGGGRLVQLDRPDLLAELLDQTFHQPDEARRRGEEGRRIALERYSLDSVARRYIELYRSLVGRRAAGGQ